MDIKQEFSTLSKSIRWMVKGLQNPVTNSLNMNYFYSSNGITCTGCAATNAMLTALGIKDSLIGTSGGIKLNYFPMITEVHTDITFKTLNTIEAMIDNLRSYRWSNVYLDMIELGVLNRSDYNNIDKVVDESILEVSRNPVLNNNLRVHQYEYKFDITNNDLRDGKFTAHSKLDNWLRLADVLETKGY